MEEEDAVSSSSSPSSSDAETDDDICEDKVADGYTCQRCRGPVHRDTCESRHAIREQSCFDIGLQRFLTYEEKNRLADNQ